jgi:hypothetical protein
VQSQVAQEYSCDCVIYQYSGKLKSEWILYQNVIIHRHLKGRAQHSPDGMNGTVAFPILLLQFDKKQLCIGSLSRKQRKAYLSLSVSVGFDDTLFASLATSHSLEINCV